MIVLRLLLITIVGLVFPSLAAVVPTDLEARQVKLGVGVLGPASCAPGSVVGIATPPLNILGRKVCACVNVGRNLGGLVGISACPACGPASSPSCSDATCGCPCVTNASPNGSGQCQCNVGFSLNGAGACWDLKSEAPDLFLHLADSDLVIFKGDLNHRKLTYDCHAPNHASFDMAIGPLATEPGTPPVCSLRTIKSDVVVGLPEEVGPRLDKEEPGWKISGKYAVVLLSEGRKGEKIQF